MKIITGKEFITTQCGELLSDESRFSLGVPEQVCFPETLEDIRNIVFQAKLQGIPLSLIGGKTGITGGSVPIDDCIAISFSEMSAIKYVLPLPDGSPMLVCEPGISLNTIDIFCQNPTKWPTKVQGIERLLHKAYIYTPDPTEMSAQLGGTVATNASGARSYKYGSTRGFIEELSLVFSTGDTMTLRRGTNIEKNGLFTFTTDQGNNYSIKKPEYKFFELKNASGYFSDKNMDLIDLFIGSEGTLAIFYSIGIRLIPKPTIVSGLSFFPDSQSAFAAAAFFRSQPPIAAIEYFDSSALSILENSSDAMSLDLPRIPTGKTAAIYWEFTEENSITFESSIDLWESMLVRFGSSIELTWSGFTENEIQTLKTFRHAVPEAINARIATYKRDYPNIRKISTDSALPPPHFDSIMSQWITIIKQSGIEYAIFGHLGDFHLHINLIPHNQEEFDLAQRIYEQIMFDTVSCGGTISAEHGIGKIKTRYLLKMYGTDAINDMKRIKTQVDEKWLLNRGNLFTSDK